MIPTMPKQSLKWVFDTVVISNFIFSDALHLLQQRYKNKALITSEVYGELVTGMEKYPKLKEIDALFIDDSFELVTLSREEIKHCQQLLSTLDLGEASAITYAKPRRYIVVSDDRAARYHCTNIAIPVTGTIGILKACVQDQQVTLEDADIILEKMIVEGFYSPVKSITHIM